MDSRYHSHVPPHNGLIRTSPSGVILEHYGSRQKDTGNYKNLTIVLGNESCDLDSVISALVYALFLNWQYNQIRCKVCTKDNRPDTVKDDVFLPILNVDRADYPLKTEVVYLLKKHGILENHLFFRDDYDIKSLLLRPETKVVLVDHHVLSNSDQILSPYVTEIIDHRPLDKSQWSFNDDTRTTIEVVGSCCTLITQRIRDLSRLMAKHEEFFDSYPICSYLLYATIILDTVNFSKEVNKATPHDRDIILFLENLIKPDDCETERKRVLDELVTARSDVSTLDAAQLLKKDVKIVGSVLVPSFPLLVKVSMHNYTTDFLNKPGAHGAVAEALSKVGCSTALLLGMDLSQGLQRDAAVYSSECQETADLLCNHLEQWSQPHLGLTEERLSHAADFKYYCQGNLTASRKQFIPAVNALYK